MRVLFIAALLLLAGCVTPGALNNNSAGLVMPEVPMGATVETIPGGLRLLFDAVAFPFAENITIPVGTTLVRATGIVGPDESISVNLRDAETGRRRCNFAPVDAWDVPVTGEGSCTGVTLVDKLPATWQVRGSSIAGKGKVQVDLLTTPLDGPLAELDVSQLSMRDFEVDGTEVLRVPSFDGTEMHVEVTLPKGAGPWPTIISSSPYNNADRLASGLPAMWTYFTQDWAERGYAIVNMDVRGYGESDGCVGVWDINERKDQAFIVDWAAQQDWSDGNVGFYGQSYVATTPVEAAIQAPAALKAIIAVAPVVDSYNDWHFGGVPNGENSLSPAGYQQIGAGADGIPPSPTSLAYMAQHARNGFCDPTITLIPNDPRATYDAFYEERNFSALAGDVKAAVLYTQGYEDSNVKSAEIPDWFNALTSPKLGLFGHWVHQHPTRADNEALFLLWLDQYVKGKPVGFEKLPAVRALTSDGRERTADAWPPMDATPFFLQLDPAGGKLSAEPATGSVTLLMDSTAGALPLPLGMLPVGVTHLTMTSEPLAAPVHLAGQGVVHIEATLQGAQNAYVAAYLYEEKDGIRSLVTWGMFNLAHRHSDHHETYDPVAPSERVRVGIPLLPTEWVFAPGATLSLEMHGAAVLEWAATPPTEPGMLQLFAEGSALDLPTVTDETSTPLPAAAQR